MPDATPTTELARCGSTNAVAAAWARAGGPLPRVFAAGVQTAGRGQWGRRWRSPSGGCWFTLALDADPPDPPDAPGDPGDLPLRAAEAVRGGIQAATGLAGLEVAEPNDVLLGGRKAAGLLCERVVASGGPGGRVVTLVGVGVNANAAPAGPDPATGEALRRPAASLAAALGRPVGVRALREACVERLRAAFP